MADEDPSLPNAGWYQDPEGAPGKMRYWDGSRWTEHFHEQVPAPVPAQSDSGSRLLEAGAGVYFGLAWVALALGTIAVIAGAIEAGNETSNRFDDTEPAVVVVLGLLYVAFIALNFFVASAAIRKLLMIGETTRRTADAVETLQRERGG